MLSLLSHLDRHFGRRSGRLFIVLALVAAAVTLTGCPGGIPVTEF